jgi:hypothetical protein
VSGEATLLRAESQKRTPGIEADQGNGNIFMQLQYSKWLLGIKMRKEDTGSVTFYDSHRRQNGREIALVTNPRGLQSEIFILIGKF